MCFKLSLKSLSLATCIFPLKNWLHDNHKNLTRKLCYLSYPRRPMFFFGHISYIVAIILGFLVLPSPPRRTVCWIIGRPQSQCSHNHCKVDSNTELETRGWHRVETQNLNLVSIKLEVFNLFTLTSP